MKKVNAFSVTVLGIMITSLFSCSSPGEKKELLTNSGKVVVINGKGESDTIPYGCLGCEEHIQNIDVFHRIIKVASDDAKAKLNFPRSFIPVKIQVTVISEDSVVHYKTGQPIDSILYVMISYDYIASNAYGTEMDGSTILSYYLRNKEIDNSIEKIRKLKDLNFNGQDISRTFLVSEDDAFIHIIPILRDNMKSVSLVVQSSLTCVDRSAALTFYFEDDSQLKIYSWNDFNCDPVSFYNLSTAQLQTLSKQFIKSVSYYSRKDLISGNPEPNNSDYFMQLAKISL